jgi:exodeoxyribonuclease VII small subunit
MSAKSKESEKEKGFEDNLRRLEKIVDELEQGDVPLDDALKMYEEGIALSKACTEKLSQAELRIKKLSKDMDGAFHLVEEEEPEQA